MIVEQNSFSSGLDIISQDTQIDPSGYQWIINGRQRFGNIEPIANPILETAPSGKKQGIIGVGNITILFIAGKAYYQLFNSSTWIQIAGFNLDATVDQYFSHATPASSKDYVRKLNPDGNIASSILLTHDFKPNGTPVGILVQDGINQAQFITFNEITETFSSRTTQNYTQWDNTITGQEYVPIGLNMFDLNGILFIVSPDGTELYRSVTGQYLNFMVNVDKDGNKLATEDLGGASSTSLSFDYDPITNVTPINIPNSFICATKNTTRVIVLDYTRTIFGEPLTQVSATIAAGILNQYALVEALGDYGFIDYEGVKSFDAVQQLKFSGRNAPFSLKISKLIDNVKQQISTCISFNNFLLFNILTPYGYVIAVYDNLSLKWISIDSFGIAAIKQWALVDISSETRLTVITTDDKVYQLYSINPEAPLASPQLLTRAYSAQPVEMDVSGTKINITTEIKSQRVDLIFREGSQIGNASLQEICDEIPGQSLTKPLTAFDKSQNANLPLIMQNYTTIQRATFAIPNGRRGTKLAYLISWNSDAKLSGIFLQTSDYNAPVSGDQKQQTYGK